MNERRRHNSFPSNGASRFRRIALLCFTVLFLPALTACPSTGQSELGKQYYRQIDFQEYGIALSLPRDWNISVSRTPVRHYQVIATGFSPNNLPVTMEYRLVKLPGRYNPAQKNRFANGWYDAEFRNFSRWQYVSRGRFASDREGGYHFEGTFDRKGPENGFKRKDVASRFRRAGVTYRRFGRLKFRGSQAHAIYYTAPDSSPDRMRAFFSYMDSLHRFYTPVATPVQ